MTVQEWIEAYGRAWLEKDADAAARLFTGESRYREQPFDEPFTGRAGVRSYWQQVTATQEHLQARFGKPIVTDDGRRATVAYWVTMLERGAAITLAGVLVLRFDADGLCEELWEAWHQADGSIEPFAGWDEP